MSKVLKTATNKPKTLQDLVREAESYERKVERHGATGLLDLVYYQYVKYQPKDTTLEDKRFAGLRVGLLQTITNCQRDVKAMLNSITVFTSSTPVALSADISHRLGRLEHDARLFFDGYAKGDLQVTQFEEPTAYPPSSELRLLRERVEELQDEFSKSAGFRQRIEELYIQLQVFRTQNLSLSTELGCAKQTIDDTLADNKALKEELVQQNKKVEALIRDQRKLLEVTRELNDLKQSLSVPPPVPKQLLYVAQKTPRAISQDHVQIEVSSRQHSSDDDECVAEAVSLEPETTPKIKAMKRLSQIRHPKIEPPVVKQGRRSEGGTFGTKSVIVYEQKLDTIPEPAPIVAEARLAVYTGEYGVQCDEVRSPQVSQQLQTELGQKDIQQMTSDMKQSRELIEQQKYNLQRVSEQLTAERKMREFDVSKDKAMHKEAIDKLTEQLAFLKSELETAVNREREAFAQSDVLVKNLRGKEVQIMGCQEEIRKLIREIKEMDKTIRYK